jgi:hypothetical protein
MKENIYSENGFKNRKEYLKSLAEEFSVDHETVFFLADLLGPAEDFDGLISSLEDIEDIEDIENHPCLYF